MSTVNSVSSNPAALAALNSELGASAGSTTLTQANFLNLLTTQLENQDPLNPMSDTDFIAQMANFSSLQEMTTLTQNFSDFSASDLVTAAQGYLGNQVTVTDPTLGSVTGTVTGVDISSGTPEIMVNGTNYDISAIQSISQPQSATSSTTNTTNSQ